MARCDDCHQPIDERTHPFTLRMELFHAVEPSLNISEEELGMDFEAEMQRLIDQMETMSAADVDEQGQRIHASWSFTLCPACRDRLARRLEGLGPHNPKS